MFKVSLVVTDTKFRKNTVLPSSGMKCVGSRISFVIQVIYVGWLPWDLTRGVTKINLAGANGKKRTKMAFVRATLCHRRGGKSSRDKKKRNFPGIQYCSWEECGTAVSRATFAFPHRKKI
jgi:hypothetical protein